MNATTTAALDEVHNHNIIDILSSSSSTVSASGLPMTDASSTASTELGYSLGECAIRFLDIMHMTTGLPWWATIIASTMAVRITLFPMSIMSMRNAARMQIMKPKLEKLTEEMKNDPSAHDPKKAVMYRQRANALFKENNVRPFLSLLMPLSQLPIFLGFFWGLKGITQYIPEYAMDGAFWFQNLASPDPTYTLPLLSSALMIASVEAGGEGMPAEFVEKAKMGMRIVAFIMIPVASTFESVT
jgi:YidC/Oxa1 family membrane protein insertase